jgi:hypothetical protein
MHRIHNIYCFSTTRETRKRLNVTTYVHWLSCNRDGVHCTVRVDSVNVAQLNLVFKVVRSQRSPRETRSGQCGSATWVSPGFPLSISIYQCSIPIFIYTLLLQEAQTAQPGDIQKTMIFWKSQSTSTFPVLKNSRNGVLHLQGRISGYLFQ